MARVYNFSPGPALLPVEVLEQARQALLEWQDLGVGIMEISHRSQPFITLIEQIGTDLRELLQIPNNYRILFLAGGATQQFAMLPLNLLRGKKTVDYLDTGVWSQKALKEAQKYCHVNIVASSTSDYNFIPARNTWCCDSDAAYFHYTANETISGVEFHAIPQVGDVPLVADFTSNILSTPLDVSRFGVIYAACQKNLGVAGMTVVIVRDDLLGEPHLQTPSVYNYTLQAEQNSLYNTPPTFIWYLCGLILTWLKRQGGLAAIAEINQRKATTLYTTIDDSQGFYRNRVAPEFRSRMNVPFTLHDALLEAVFLQEALQAGLAFLKGHKLQGGIRASIYNAMPEAGVVALSDFMQDFKRRYG